METQTSVLSTEGGVAFLLGYSFIHIAANKEMDSEFIFSKVTFHFSRINRKRFVVIGFLD